jgi:hypothetical protein
MGWHRTDSPDPHRLFLQAKLADFIYFKF